MTYLLGFLLAVCYIPLVTGTAILTQWLLLGVALPMMILTPLRITPVHWLGCVFLAYVCASLTWTENIYDSGWTVFCWIVLAMAFCLGSLQESLRPIFVGICVGLMFSVLFVVLAQAGWRPIYQQAWDAPAGLFVAPNALGSILAIAVVAAVVYEIWWFVPFGIYGLISSNYRIGVIAALICAVPIYWRISKRVTIYLICAVTLCVIALTLWKATPAGHRLEYWSSILPVLSWQGYGIGSFFQLYPTLANELVSRPEHAYNDYLELVFELGLGVLPLWLLLALCFEAKSDDRLILACFLLQSLAFFPLSVPLSAFMAALVAGQLARVRALDRDKRGARRRVVPLSKRNWGLGASADGREGIPVVARDSYEAWISGDATAAILGDPSHPRGYRVQ